MPNQDSTSSADTGNQPIMPASFRKVAFSNRLSSNKAKTISKLGSDKRSSKNRQTLWGKVKTGSIEKPQGPAPATTPDTVEVNFPSAPGRLKIEISPKARLLLQDLFTNSHFSKLLVKTNRSTGRQDLLASDKSGRNERTVGEFIIERRPAGTETTYDYEPKVRFDVGELQQRDRLVLRVTMPNSRQRLLAQFDRFDSGMYRRPRQGFTKVQASDQANVQNNEENGNSPVQAFIDSMLNSNNGLSLLEDESTSVDDNMYYDFVDQLYVCDPVYEEPLMVSGEIPEAVAKMNEELEAEGIDSADNWAFYVMLNLTFIRRVRELLVGQHGTQPPDSTINSQYAPGIKRILDILYQDANRVSHFQEVYWKLNFRDQRNSLLKWIVDAFEKLEITGQGGTLKLISLYNYLQPSDRYTPYPDESISLRWLTVEGVLLEEWSEVSSIPENEEDNLDTLFDPPTSYPFKFYAPESFNLGLRLVYRQEWRSLGNQRGELVKTIPLGPKQVERVSIKTSQRSKITRSNEQLQSSETTTESTTSNKSSSDIVSETARSSGWHAEASASASFGFGSAQVTAGAEGTSSSRSQNTSSRLSESVQKSASKMRLETKVSVTAEHELGYESERSSEIVNPNDEIAVTYVYSKLHRQMEVLTRLADVQNVVLVPEPVIGPNEVTDDWIRQHDWIIAKSLLDDSFRDALADISQDVVPSSDNDNGLMGNLLQAMNTTISSLGDMANSSNNLTVANVDVARESQSGYRQAVKDYIGARKERQKRLYKRIRLRKHIVDNILHYQRAIWAQEDPEQRLFRYRSLGIKVPLNWRFTGAFGDLESRWNLADLNEIISTNACDNDSDLIGKLDGRFVGDSNGQMVNVCDLIDPSGPLGYVGNYAVFALQPEYDRDDVHVMLQIARAPYTYWAKTEDEDRLEPELMDPLFKRYLIRYCERRPSSYEEKFDMIDHVPDLARLYECTPDSQKAAFISDSREEIFPPYYPEYRFRRDNVHRFLVDTNNLIVDVVKGTGTALETFKAAHRVLDVYQANEDLKRSQLENKRLDARNKAGKFGDPDIENMTIISTGDEALDKAVATASTGASTPRERRPIRQPTSAGPD